MKKVLTILMFVIFTLWHSVNAEDISKKQSVSIQWGPSYTAQQDLIFSPNIHQDLSLGTLSIQYANQNKWFHQLKVAYVGYQFDPQFSTYLLEGKDETVFPHSVMNIDLEYAFGRMIKPTSSFPTAVGIVSVNELQSKNYSYGRIGSFGYFLHFGLGVFAQQQLNFGDKHQLSLYAHMPLVSWTARSPYMVNDDEFIENIASHSGFKSMMAFIKDGKVQTVGDVQNVDFRTKYLYLIAKKWSVGGEYGLELWHQKCPKNFLSYEHQLQIIAQFNF